MSSTQSRFLLSATVLLSSLQLASAATFQDALRHLDKLTPSSLTRSTPTAEVLHPAGKTVDRGHEIFHFQSYVGSYKVFGEQSVVIFPPAGKAPFTVNSAAATTQQITELSNLSQRSLSRNISVERAQQIATQDLRQKGTFLQQSLPASAKAEPELVMFRGTGGVLHLTHHLVMPSNEHGMPALREYFIDAADGKIVAAVTKLFDALGDPEPLKGTGIGLTSDQVVEFAITNETGKWRLHDTARNLSISNQELDTYSTDEDHVWDSVGTDRPSNQRAEVQLYLNFMKIVDWYKARINYTWDGTVQAVAHVNDPSTGSPNYNNAFFNPWYNAFFFGDGSNTEGGFDYLGKALDVSAHEFGHGFIEAEGPLMYQHESGALNEHWADLFGACVDDDDWLIGDEITVGQSAGKGLRNMQNPSAGHPELITDGMTYQQWRELNRTRPMGERIYPDSLSKKIVCTSSEDNGGVHVNSSIMNKFAYLASSGEGLNSQGLGRQLLVDIYVKAAKNKLYGSTATFAQFREAILAAAKLQLEGDPNLEVYTETLKKAYAAVGL